MQRAGIEQLFVQEDGPPAHGLNDYDTMAAINLSVDLELPAAMHVLLDADAPRFYAVLTLLFVLALFGFLAYVLRLLHGRNGNSKDEDPPLAGKGRPR